MEDLTISGYRGTNFPEWLGHQSLPNLVSLSIEECKNCFKIPPLGQLDSLKRLYISGCSNIEAIDTSFYGSLVSTNKPFKSLQILRFEGMPEWRIWDQHDGAFPSLELLQISGCPKLVNALPNELPSLKTLEIRGCKQLMSRFPRVRANVELWLEDVILDTRDGLRFYQSTSGSLDQILEDLQQMGASIYDQKQVALRTWETTICQNLEGVIQKFKRLDYLTIGGYSKLVTFPKCELAYQSLTKLNLHSLRNLESLPQQMKSVLPSLLELRLKCCPELVSFPAEGLPLMLEKLEIRSCKRLMVGRMQWNLQALPLLSSLTISDDEDMEFFPEPMLLPCTLTTLDISELRGLKRLDYEELTCLRKLSIDDCELISEVPKFPSTITHLYLRQMKMKSLDGWDLHRLTCLRELKIYDCEFLESISEEALPFSLKRVELSNCPMLGHITREGLPPSLETLFIRDCPLLEEKYNEKEEEWHIISNIANVSIG